MTQTGIDSRQGVLDGVITGRTRRKINELAHCKERVSGAVNLGCRGSRTMHILDELADLFAATTTAAVLHHEDATRTWIWIRERHLRRETLVNETKTTTRVIANALVFEELHETVARHGALDDIVCNDTVEREGWKDGVARASNGALAPPLARSTVFGKRKPVEEEKYVGIPSFSTDTIHVTCAQFFTSLRRRGSGSRASDTRSPASAAMLGKRPVNERLFDCEKTTYVLDIITIVA